MAPRHEWGPARQKEELIDVISGLNGYVGNLYTQCRSSQIAGPSKPTALSNPHPHTAMPRLILLVCALPALLAEEISAPLDCSLLCTTARNGMGSAKAGGCAAERNKMPRPKVGTRVQLLYGKLSRRRAA